VEEIVFYLGEYGNHSQCRFVVTKVMCHINFLADEPIILYEGDFNP